MTHFHSRPQTPENAKAPASQRGGPSSDQTITPNQHTCSIADCKPTGLNVACETQQQQDLDKLRAIIKGLEPIIDLWRGSVDTLTDMEFGRTPWGVMALDTLWQALANLAPVWTREKHDSLTQPGAGDGAEWLDAETYIQRNYGRKPRAGEAADLTRRCISFIELDRPSAAVVQLLKGNSRIVRYFRRSTIDHVVSANWAESPPDPEPPATPLETPDPAPATSKIDPNHPIVKNLLAHQSLREVQAGLHQARLDRWSARHPHLPGSRLLGRLKRPPDQRGDTG